MNKKKRKRRMKYRLPEGKKGLQVTLALTFLFCLALVCTGNLLHKDRKLSEKEMRVLAQRPSLSIESIASGRFMNEYEAYVSDQFAGRDIWVQIKTLADTFAGKKEENGVFNGKGGYLLEDIAVPNETELSDTLKAMKKFREKYKDIPMHMMLVPNAANILKDKLPSFAVTADQSRMIEKVKHQLEPDFNWIDAEKTMREHKEEQIYYRTDHHWTTQGAYYVFEDAKKGLGIDAKEKVNRKLYAVSNSFNGTLAARSGYQTGYKEPIYVYLQEEESAPQIVVNYVEEQKKSASLYEVSKLKERDQYGVFLGGNHAISDIRTTRKDGERLLVIKDSYANCFVPFLVPYYREMVVVDPRYYSGNLNRLMEEKRIDRVLFLYNANTFFEDRMLFGVLGTEEME